jgi:hypothetical protein
VEKMNQIEKAKKLINENGNEMALEELEEQLMDWVLEQLTEHEDGVSVTNHGGRKHIMLLSEESERIESKYGK